MCPIIINDVRTTGFLDLGSGVSILPHELINVLHLVLEPPSINVRLANGQILPLLGQVKVFGHIRNQNCQYCCFRCL